MTYKEKLRDPRWLKKREQLLLRRGEKCQSCQSSKHLTIHHGYYRPQGAPWNYEDDTLWVLCWTCHERVQNTLTEIHQLIGCVHPDSYSEIQSRIGDATFEHRYGISQEELKEILQEVKEAESRTYAEYSASITSSNELGPTLAYNLEDFLRDRFPGIDTEVLSTSDERDAVAEISGPDQEVVDQIRHCCDKWIN